MFYILLYNIAFSIKSPEYIIKNQLVYKKYGLLRWEDGNDHSFPQDFADMLGWKELGEKIDVIYSKMPNKDQTLILCDNYGQAGAINYYTKNKQIKAVSFNADYINWFKLDVKIVNFIRVKEYNGSENELAETSPFFDTAFVADSLNNSLAREYKTMIFAFMSSKIDINKRLRIEVDKRKNFH